MDAETYWLAMEPVRQDIARALQGVTTMPVDLMCLTPQERTIYQALVDAAEAGKVCPDHLDLNELVGYESTSSSSGAVRRLVKKGLIVREIDSNRFRRIQIVATGKWTKPSPHMRMTAPFKPRGTHDPRPLKKAIVDLMEGLLDEEGECVGQEIADDASLDFASLLRLEKRLDRAKELVVRRKGHFLTNPGKPYKGRL